MRRDRELMAGLAAMAAVAGVGFASGREIVLFFSQLGWAAWPGMILASLLFGLMTGVILRLGQKTGAVSVPDVFNRLLGGHWGNGIGMLYGLLMALAAAMMLKTCGELGALALPVRNGYLHGMLMALLIAIVICTGPTRLLPVLGMCAVIAATAFYAALMVDFRPVRTHIRVETVLRLEGSVWSAVVLALLHGCLNASVAAGAAMRFAGGSVRPRRAAIASAGMMLVCLLCAHGAILRGGEALYAQSLPTVILAARWGIAGFWLSVGFMYLMSVCTLSACMGALFPRKNGAPMGQRIVSALSLLAFFCFCAPGTDGVIGLGFPLLGWICALGVAVLACRFDCGIPIPRPCEGSPASYAKND